MHIKQQRVYFLQDVILGSSHKYSYWVYTVYCSIALALFSLHLFSVIAPFIVVITWLWFLYLVSISILYPKWFKAFSSLIQHPFLHIRIYSCKSFRPCFNHLFLSLFYVLNANSNSLNSSMILTNGPSIMPCSSSLANVFILANFFS